MKPLSALGLTHKFWDILRRREIHHKIRNEFPRLAVDVFKNNPQGMNAFLEEYLLNLDMFKDMDADEGQQVTVVGDGHPDEEELLPCRNQQY
jgi:hypothetical protein